MAQASGCRLRAMALGLMTLGLLVGHKPGPAVCVAIRWPAGPEQPWQHDDGSWTEEVKCENAVNSHSGTQECC